MLPEILPLIKAFVKTSAPRRAPACDRLHQEICAADLRPMLVCMAHKRTGYDHDAQEEKKTAHRG